MSETRKQILLKVPGSLVEAWIKGDATMPDWQLMNLAATLNALARSKTAP